jgi:hypothetical protein
MRAFILGNGLSINDTPLDLLKDEVTFGMNQIMLKYPDTEWRPTYYLFFENIGVGNMRVAPFWNSYLDYVVPEMQSGRLCYISEHLQPKIMEFTRYKPFHNVTYVPYRCDHHGAAVMDNCKPDHWHLPNFCHYGGTMNMGLQLAFSMGYDPIYLVGCDLGYTAVPADALKDPNHFHPDYWTWSDNNIEDMDATLTDMHRIAKEEFDRMDRKIYNATIGGSLEVYERVDFKGLF